MNLDLFCFSFLSFLVNWALILEFDQQNNLILKILRNGTQIQF